MAEQNGCAECEFKKLHETFYCYMFEIKPAFFFKTLEGLPVCGQYRTKGVKQCLLTKR